jgi:hypothetical protein
VVTDNSFKDGVQWEHHKYAVMARQTPSNHLVQNFGKVVGKVLLHVRFPWRRDIGALSRNNAEYTTVAYATMYIRHFTTIKMDSGHCWRVTLLRCANVSMVMRFVVDGVGLICRAVRVLEIAACRRACVFGYGLLLVGRLSYVFWDRTGWTCTCVRRAVDCV